MVFARSLSDLIQVVSGSVEPQELIGTDILSVQDVFFLEILRWEGGMAMAIQWPRFDFRYQSSG